MATPMSPDTNPHDPSSPPQQSLSEQNQVEQLSQSNHLGLQSIPPADTYERIPLPPLELPKFSGDYIRFTYWFESMTQLIINNPALSEISKLLYVMNSLEGDAEQLVACCGGGVGALEIVMSTLKQCYGEKFMLERALREKIEGIDTHGLSLEQTHCKLIEMQSLIRVLKNCDVYMANDHLVATVMNAAPTELARLALSSLRERFPSADALIQEILSLFPFFASRQDYRESANRGRRSKGHRLR